ncbi:hypothetical protein [Acetobacter syzygii]|uniref:hypothetical protein n=1 Tax=Acetobacter syzygii TaxID=146476 RepID=UPI0011780BD4|nr:hypothetical protein [Acetobacter syzygii]NSL92719.1 hypothetical protein [Acetobacter syzygii]
MIKKVSQHDAVLSAIKTYTKKSTSNKEDAQKSLIDMGFISKSGKLSNKYTVQSMLRKEEKESV